MRLVGDTLTIYTEIGETRRWAEEVKIVARGIGRMRNQLLFFFVANLCYAGQVELPYPDEKSSEWHVNKYGTRGKPTRSVQSITAYLLFSNDNGVERCINTWHCFILQKIQWKGPNLPYQYYCKKENYNL